MFPKRSNEFICRITALELLMCLSQVHDGADATDAELRCCIADVFMFFLPGLACGLRNIAFEDEKSGHKVIAVSISTILKRWNLYCEMIDRWRCKPGAA